MKRILFFALLGLSYASSFSQVSITVGKPYVDLGLSLNYFRQGNYIVALKWDGKKPVLQQFNITTITQQCAFRYDDFPKKFDPQHIIKIGSSPYFIYSVNEKHSIVFFC